jgi:hypothetical protein
LRTLLLFLLFTLPVNAGPIKFVKEHKRFFKMELANAAGVTINAIGTAHCRTGDVENCTGHYGAAWATFAVQATMGLVVAPTLAEWSWRDGDKTLGYVIGYTPAAFNAAWGVNEWHQYGPENSIQRDWLYNVRRKK